MAKLGQNNLGKRKRISRKCENISIAWLDKNWVDIFLQDFKTSIKGDVKRDSLIIQCLPQATYKKIANLWGLEPEKIPRLNGNTCKLKNAEEENAMVEEFIKSVERDLGIRSDISEDLQVNVESVKRSEIKAEDNTKRKHAQFLNFLKIQRDVDTEKMSESNLPEKAKKITEEIIKNFLDWYQSLGGQETESLIDENTLQELFQIGFDLPAAKALIIRIREMLTIPDCLAILTNEPKRAVRYVLKKYLQEDIRKESLLPRMFAFGKMLPKEKPTLRFKPPKNFVKKSWLECSRVPPDLVSMKVVWTGIETLRSTIAFSNWLKNNPEIQPPAYLLEQGLLQIDYDEWHQIHKKFDIDKEVVETIEAPVAEKSIIIPSIESLRTLDSIESFS